ncbi:MAG TPA: metalloregulator ArsR/SmtB family transcription factor [Candidatus Anoxymicrobiaceae bacterium]
MAAHEPKCKTDPRLIELADELRTLADPNRLRIMCFLSRGESCVCDIETELGISQQLTSHHVNVLKEAGFLTLRKEGTRYNYSIDREFLKGVNEVFSEYLDYRNVGCGRPKAACSKG